MRQINDLIIHCSATFPDRCVTIADITRWHQQRGWKTIGYHYVILPDGTVQTGRPLEEAGAHCRNHNAHSIGICYIGGMAYSNGARDTTGKGYPSDTRTEAQKAALRRLLQELRTRFPNAQIHGHSNYAPKACPCFDAPREYADLL